MALEDTRFNLLYGHQPNFKFVRDECPSKVISNFGPIKPLDVSFIETSWPADMVFLRLLVILFHNTHWVLFYTSSLTNLILQLLSNYTILGIWGGKFEKREQCAASDTLLILIKNRLLKSSFSLQECLRGGFDTIFEPYSVSIWGALNQTEARGSLALPLCDTVYSHCFPFIVTCFSMNLTMYLEEWQFCPRRTNETTVIQRSRILILKGFGNSECLAM